MFERKDAVKSKHRHHLLTKAAACGFLAMAGVLPGAAQAQRAAITFDIPSQPLRDALMQLSRQAGVDIAAPARLTAGRTAPAVRGMLPPERALDQILAGTGLSYRKGTGNSYIVESVGNAPQASVDPDTGGPSAGQRDIVVTAQKRSERLADVPMTVTALQGSDLNALQQRDFQSYAKLVPGLSLDGSSPGATRVTLRGLNVGGAGSTVAVYVDESPFGSSTALLNGGLLSGNFDTWDLQRVEILSGPQGTLYGASSEGGLIKFVTNAPNLHKFEGAAEVTEESIRNGGNGVVLRGMVNVPIGDTLAVRLSGYRETMPGYIDNPILGIKDVNGGHKYGGRASVLFKPAPNFSIRLTADFQNLKLGGSYTEDVNPVTLQPIHGDLVQQRFLREKDSFDYRNYNATINWDLGGVSLVSTTTYAIQNVDFPIDYTSVDAGGITYGGYLSGAFGQPLAFGLAQTIDLKKVTQELRLASGKSKRFDWQIGGYFTHEKAFLGDQFTAYTLGTRTPAAGVPNPETLSLKSTYSEFALFANGTIHLAHNFDIEAGGRYSHNKQNALEQGSGFFIDPPISFQVPSKGDVFTFSVAPRWKISPDLMVYGRVASGYRPGGPNVLPPMAPPDVPRQYGADRTTNYEIGLRSRLFDGRLSMDLTAFQVDWRKIQLLVVVDNTGINGNGGGARSRGFEWNITAKPISNLTLRYIGAYTDAKLTEGSPVIGALAGSRLPFAPRWSQTVDGEYDLPIASGRMLFAGATWAYIGKRDSLFLQSGPQKPFPHYDTVDLRAGLRAAHYTAQIYVKNLGDKRGITAYGSGAVAPDSAGSLSVIQPRTIGVSISTHF